MHATHGTLYVDSGDTVEVHGKLHELRVLNRNAARDDTVFTIVLPSDPNRRLEFLGQLGEATASLTRYAYGELAQDPRARQVRPGEIAANE
jgi:hypothetical protein